MRDRRSLLSVSDGPESIEIYESVGEGIVDIAAHLPALYLVATTYDAHVKLGPFCLNSIREQLLQIIGHYPPEETRIAVEKEREACATIAEGIQDSIAEAIAERIRARRR